MDPDRVSVSQGITIPSREQARKRTRLSRCESRMIPLGTRYFNYVCARQRLQSASRFAKNARRAESGSPFARVPSPALLRHTIPEYEEWTTVPAVSIFRGGSCLEGEGRGETARDISGCCFVRRAASSSLSFPSFSPLLLPFCGNPIVSFLSPPARPLSRRE